MAIKIGDDNTRNIPVTAKEPLENDQYASHKCILTFEVLPSDIWRTMTARWRELTAMQARMKTDPEYQMCAADLAEAEEPLYEIAGRYLRDMTGLEDVAGQPIAFSDAILHKILAIPWLRDPIVDGFMAVQGGKTMTEFLRNRDDDKKQQQLQQLRGKN